jgi:hypothetical protein
VKSRRVRAIRRFAGAVLIAVLLVWVPTAAFIAVKCYRPGARDEGARSAVPADIPGYGRSEAFTYLTLPEWYIVYSTDEYARFVERRSPSDFPYFTSIRDYWGYYGAVCEATRSAYPFETGYHVMLGVIGASFTIENTVKALYERTVGRLSARLATRDTSEDRFAAIVAREYGRFMHTVPWYEFPFAARLRRLWTEVPLSGPHMTRKIERRFALSVEYGLKAAYGFLIGRASQGAYGPEDLKIYARIEQPLDAAARRGPIELVRRSGSAEIVRLPRYEAFTTAAVSLADGGAGFVDIAGNDEILVTVLAPAAFGERKLPYARTIASRPIPTDPSRKRLAIQLPVARLRDALPALRAEGATIEHLYDY